MSKFESIFSSNTNVKSNLNSLFAKKTANAIIKAQTNDADDDTDNEEEREEQVQQLKNEIKKVKEYKVIVINEETE